MAKQDINSKQGFTIIEVVLVLAIAGLIFLMVFIAWPALQRSQHDTQRRDDMARFISQLSQYQTNNSGRTPGSNNAAGATAGDYNGFISSYLLVGGDRFSDPSTDDTYIVADVTSCQTADACRQKSVADDRGTGRIHVYTHATCEGETPVQKPGKNNIAITIQLEGAGIYCGHN